MLEHIICSNLMQHLENHGILNERQHAFRKHHSCETQLVNVIHDWATSIDQRKQVDIFILDFEKAFDTVPHELLKTKLHKYGISKNILNWIDAFLGNRTQCVVVNGTKSETSTVISGVPQGTVLGPILFLVHINDISENITSDIRLFADDCVCYREINNKEDCNKLQDDINRLGNWATSWGMRFQPIKCNMLRLSRKKRNIMFDYTLKDTKLEFLTSIKYLGVHITDDLHWGKHIEEVCNKAYRTLGLLKRTLSSCPQEVKIQAYKGLIRPVLEYSSAVWDPHQQYLQDKLENVQRRSARFITSNYTDYEPGSMTAILKQLELPSLKERRKQSRLILLHKGIHNHANIPTEHLKSPSRRTKNMHQHHFLRIPANTDSLKFSFLPNTIKDWNSLPPDLFNKVDGSSDPIKTFSEIIRGATN